MGEESECCRTAGPCYGTPLEAMSGPREALLYVTCVYNGDELHHSGWNACSSCHGNPSADRRFLILPSLLSGWIYVIDTKTCPKAPSLHKVVQPEDIVKKTSLAYPYTPHCLASGDIMISCLGDKDGNAKGDRIPNSMSKGAFTKGFDLQDVADGLYGRHLHVSSWSDGELKQTMDLGDTGLIPLEVIPFSFRSRTCMDSFIVHNLMVSMQTRFLHEPSEDTGYVGCALTSNMVRFFKTEDGSWSHEVAISVKPLMVQNWILPEMPGLITEFLISLDDRFLYFVNWLHRDVRQYNTKNPKNPVLAAQVWVGGLLQKGSPIVVTEDGKTWQSDVPEIQDCSKTSSKRGTADGPAELRREAAIRDELAIQRMGSTILSGTYG
ncbi:Selenium-binding protein 2 [Hibiscus syriacus]|uniref:Selenium-binding protein 2 n=1 Tax=Hibiscus syriacus TaxID=106335 RepID=A0A6A3BAV1_HIBSY|nr:Selenium-binding protein 2 [Hibiscus syriacus]